MQTLATFRVVPPPGRRADRVTVVLGIPPTVVHEAGDPFGRGSPRQCEAGMWSLCSAADVRDDVELDASLQVVLGLLEPVTDRLWDLHEQGHRMDWFCYVGSHATEHAVELDRSLLTRLVALPGHLLLDVYSDDENGD